MIPNIWTAYPDKDPGNEPCTFYVEGWANDNVRVLATTHEGRVCWPPVVFIGNVLHNLDIQGAIY